MPYIRTISGDKFYYHVDDPSKIDIWSIKIEDIAHSLSLLGRYNGHTKKLYSVAEHCCRVYEICADRSYDISDLRGAFMHDSPEAYIGDMPAPLKHTRVGKVFREYEDLLWLKIAERFRLSKTISPRVHEVDKEIQQWEMYNFMQGSRSPWPSDTAERVFLEYAARLDIS